MENKTKEEKNQDKLGSMMSDKTNQDYNKRTPNPNDPNEIKGKPGILLPVIGEGDSETAIPERSDNKEKKIRKRINSNTGK